MIQWNARFITTQVWHEQSQKHLSLNSKFLVSILWVHQQERERESAAFPKQSRVDWAKNMWWKRPNHILLTYEIKSFILRSFHSLARWFFKILQGKIGILYFSSKKHKALCTHSHLSPTTLERQVWTHHIHFYRKGINEKLQERQSSDNACIKLQLESWDLALLWSSIHSSNTNTGLPEQSPWITNTEQILILTVELLQPGLPSWQCPIGATDKNQK